MNSAEPLDLHAFIMIVKRRLWLILAIAATAAGLAYGWSLQQEDQFDASSKLLFRPEEPTPRIDPDEPLPEPSRAPERVAATNLALASLDSVTVRVKQRLRSPETAEKLRSRVDVAPEGQTDIVTVTAKGTTRADAVRLADTFASEVVALRRENAERRIQRVIDAVIERLRGTPAPAPGIARELRDRAERLTVERRLQEGDVELVQRATPPRDRSTPQPLRNAIIGFGLGLILSVLISLLLHRLDRRINNEEEIAEIVGVPIIARVPATYRRGTQKRGDWEQQRFLEAFQFLRANLQLRDSGNALHVIAVTSALPGDGKSLVSANLAEALALSGADVIAVDCDLRRPTLHKHFGVIGSEGVTTAIIGSKDPLELLHDTAHPGVRLLAAGPQTPLPGSIAAGTGGVPSLTERLESETDYVVVDTSPVTIAADASAIAATADGTLLVVDAQNADRSILIAAVEQLRNAQANIVGVVLNRAPVLLMDHSYQRYFRAADGSPAPPARPDDDDRAAPGGRETSNSWLRL